MFQILRHLRLYYSCAQAWASFILYISNGHHTRSTPISHCIITTTPPYIWHCTFLPLDGLIFILTQRWLNLSLYCHRFPLPISLVLPIAQHSIRLIERENSLLSQPSSDVCAFYMNYPIQKSQLTIMHQHNRDYICHCIDFMWLFKKI